MGILSSIGWGIFDMTVLPVYDAVQNVIDNARGIPRTNEPSLDEREVWELLDEAEATGDNSKVEAFIKEGDTSHQMARNALIDRRIWDSPDAYEATQAWGEEVVNEHINKPLKETPQETPQETKEEKKGFFGKKEKPKKEVKVATLKGGGTIRFR